MACDKVSVWVVTKFQYGLSQSFSMGCEWQESEAELHSLAEIHKKMIELSINGNVYSPVAENETRGEIP